jgi:LysM repeat protein
MSLIASRFNSTIDAILLATNDYNKLNKLTLLTDPNKIQVGMTLIIPVQIVTPTSTRAATSTVAPTKSSTPKP